MNINIRSEKKADQQEIYEVVKRAFETAEHADEDEHNLVNRLRNSESFIPELSIVATIDEKIIAHVLFTKAIIKNNEQEFATLALAPVSVVPEFQRKGVGSKIMTESLQKAKQLGYESVIVLGSNEYYPKFGFTEAAHFDIKAPFEVPSEFFMALELVGNSLEKVNGTVIYAPEFFEK